MKIRNQQKMSTLIWKTAAFLFPVLLFFCVLYKGGFIPLARSLCC